MKVVALQTWSNGEITMEEKSVQDIPDALAEQLIADGICADAAEYFGGGGSGGGEFVITFASFTDGAESDVTKGEIYDAIVSGKEIVLAATSGSRKNVTNILAQYMGRLTFQIFAYEVSANANLNKFGVSTYVLYSIESGATSKATLSVSNYDSGSFVVKDDNGTLNKTYNEIKARYEYNRVMIREKNGTAWDEVTSIYNDAEGYYVRTATNKKVGAGNTYKATVDTGYPVLQA